MKKERIKLAYDSAFQERIVRTLYPDSAVQWRWRSFQAISFVDEKIRRRFWSHVAKSDDCWLWQGAPNSTRGSGTYGRIVIYGKQWLAHRAAWLITFGNPLDSYVCHRCDNHKCVRPDHLFIGTQRDNMRDMIAKGRNANVGGSRNANAKLNEDDVREIRRRCVVESTKDVAYDFGVTKNMIRAILRGENWKHVK